MTEDFETCNTGTVRALSLHQLALTAALKVIDIMETQVDSEELAEVLMAEGEDALNTLRLLRAELEVDCEDT